MEVTVKQAKQHLRIDNEAEDEYIQSLIDAATETAWDHLGVDLSETMPRPVRAAILLQVGDMYENREAGGRSTLGTYVKNPTYERLLNPYRVMDV